MKKPSERILEIQKTLNNKFPDKTIKALIFYLDEEWEKEREDIGHIYNFNNKEDVCTCKMCKLQVS